MAVLVLGVTVVEGVEVVVMVLWKGNVKAKVAVGTDAVLVDVSLVKQYS